MENYNSYSPEYNNETARPNAAPVYATVPTYTTAPAPAQKKRGGFVKTVAVAVCCSLLGGFVGSAVVSRNNAQTAQTAPAGSSVTTVTESKRTAKTVTVAMKETGELKTAAEVYAENVNSTVGINTSITTNYFGYRTSAAASGSGFIITADGYIVTNYHVIEDSNSITVTTYDGTEYDAALVGGDESNDLAVIKIEAEGLTPVVLGDSDLLSVGDDVVAIGNPLGELTFSLTKGVVSALDREVTLSSSVTMKLIQTDTAINSGNSGGALFNMYGEVVGITNAKYSSSNSYGSDEASIDNIGFAIPISDVKALITQIMEKGYVSKPYIGVSVGDGDNGALVDSVAAGSPAEKAGIAKGDEITETNGKAVGGADDLVEIVGATVPGDTLTVKVLRDGETVELTVTVGEKAQSAAQSDASSGQSDPYGGYSGQSPYGYGGYGGYGYGGDSGSGYGFGYGDFGSSSGAPRF